MADDRLVQELPLPCVLDDHDVDLLLEKLRAVHGEAGRPDIAVTGSARRAEGKSVTPAGSFDR